MKRRVTAKLLIKKGLPLVMTTVIFDHAYMQHCIIYLPEAADSSQVREHFTTRYKFHHHVQVRVVLMVGAYV